MPISDDISDAEPIDSLESDEGAEDADALIAFLTGGRPGIEVSSSDDEFERPSNTQSDDDEGDPDDNESEGVVQEAMSNVDEKSPPVVRGASQGRRVDVQFKLKRKVAEKWKELNEQPLNARQKMSKIRVFANTLGVKIHHREQLERWTQIAMMGGKRKRSNRRRDKIQLTVLDQAVKVWVSARREARHIVAKSDILKKANQLLEEEVTIRNACRGKLCVSRNWVGRFMARAKLTTKSAKRRMLLTPEEIMTKAQLFHTMIYRCVNNCDGVLNVDEVPLSLSGRMNNSLRTVTTRDDKDACVNIDAGCFKRCATVIVGALVRREGETWVAVKLKPVVILKGQPSQARVMNEVYDVGAMVLWSKCGVVDSFIMKQHVIPHLRREVTAAGVSRALLIMDSASSHVTSEVICCAWRASLPAVIIPAGCTSKLQWVDTHLASRLRVYHWELFRSLGVTKLSAQQKRKLLIRLVVSSYAEAFGSPAQEFRRLGYTDPVSAEIRDMNYRFTQPELTREEVANDTATMLQRIHAAANEDTPSPSPRRPVGRPSGKHPPQRREGGDIRDLFRRVAYTSVTPKKAIGRYISVGLDAC